MLKKILKITGITLLVLLALAFLIPVVFKKQIVDLVKSEINKSINANVEFKDVTLSLFRHFPSVSISISELSVVGVNEFASDTLISTKTLDATANLWSIIKGKNIKVYGVYLSSPRIHALVNKEGKANWDIAKETSDHSAIADTSSSNFQLNLKKYEIRNGYLLYRDEEAGINTEIINFDHQGKGDFTQDVFTLSTNTNAAEANFSYENIPYLINTKTDIVADIKINNKTSTYSIATDDIRLNNLKLSLNGFIQLVNDSVYNMDFKFKTPANDFKDILSLIPAIYKNDFDKLNAGGKASFDGFVKGSYSPTTLPAYDVHAEIKDGSFQYPDLPKKVENIQLTLRASNPDGIADHAVIDIPSAHLEMGHEPFDFHLIFKNPETIKYLDAAAKGRLDLTQVSNFIKLGGGTKLKGSVLADVYAKGNLSAIEQQQGSFIAGGFLDIRDLFYSSKDFPQPVQNGNMKIELQNSGGIADQTQVNISSAHVELGNDPFDFSLKLNKPVSAIEFAGNAKGRFTLDNLKQFVQLEKGTEVSGIMTGDVSFSGSKAAIDKSEYSKINTAGAIDLKNIKYRSKDYPDGVNIAASTINLDPKNIRLSNTQASYLNSNFSVNGELDNLIGYAMENQTLKGNINIKADKINLNDWMGTDTVSSPANSASQPFQVPANVNLTVHANADQVKYDKVNYNNVDGILIVNNETVKLEKVKTEALDGTIEVNGSYSTKTNKKQPAISLNYNVQDLNVQKAFYSFNTIQKLMPIGQFLDGKLSSQLSLTGNLNGDMMPEFSSLTGNGNLLLLKGILKKFAPLEKLASTLQIDDLKEISIKDIKNYIEFANGKVLVKPFTVKVKDIEMQIGGTHGFDQSVNYIIQMNVPRKYLGAQGNAFINNLATQASNKGIPVTLGDMVHLNIKMGGTITNPTIKTDLKEVAGDVTKELKQQAVDFAKSKIDSTRSAVKDSLVSVKNQLVNDVKQDLTKQLLQPKDSSGSKISLDSTKKKAESILKNGLNNFLKKKKPADTTRKQ
jgi:hypothetical protein